MSGSGAVNAAQPRQDIIKYSSLVALCCCDTKENESLKEKLGFPVDFYIKELGVKSSFFYLGAKSCGNTQMFRQEDFLCAAPACARCPHSWVSVGTANSEPLAFLSLIRRDEIYFPATEESLRVIAGHCPLLPARD